MAELRDALLRTPPDQSQQPGETGDAVPVLSVADVEKVVGAFSGRRAFSKSSLITGAGGKNRRGGAGGAGGEVFRYREFVNSVVGGNGNGTGSRSGSEDGGDEEER